jgi:hypothetical protein
VKLDPDMLDPNLSSHLEQVVEEEDEDEGTIKVE